MNISIVTPVLNCSELIPVYQKSTAGAEVVIVDNASTSPHAENWREFAKGAGGIYIRNNENRRFAPANNQGMRMATGDILLFMNNDVECAPGWLDQVARDVKPGGLYGVSLLSKHGIDYLEGFCIAAHRHTWMTLGGWDETLPGMYWEDNFLALKAAQIGVTLHRCRWPVYHYTNYTSRNTPGAYDRSAGNEREFVRRVMEWREGQQ